MLAELGADAEQSQTVIEAFQQRPAAQIEPVLDPHTCAQTVQHGFFGKYG